MRYGAVVAGSGPAGLAVVGNLLERRIAGKILWVDPYMRAGKLDRTWREVPSNTKAKLFLSYAKAVEPFQRIISDTPKPNAIEKMEKLDQEKGCSISYAADVCLMLTKGLQGFENVETRTGSITGADLTTCVEDSESGGIETVASPRLVLCTGSQPTSLPVSVTGLRLHRLGLETALTPSILQSTLSKDKTSTVGVIGGSHSAILVLLNLYNLASTTHPNLNVKWFTRNPLRYAKERDGWIERDNTGLKGEAAEFARENLEDSKLPSSDAGKYIEKVDCSQGEQAMYQKHFPQCTHILHAVGFANNPLPTFTSEGKSFGPIQYDHENGGFTTSEGKEIPGLFGAGIAFPERVKDPVGEVSLNVGLWKFMKYLKRVTGEWVEKSAPRSA